MGVRPGSREGTTGCRARRGESSERAVWRVVLAGAVVAAGAAACSWPVSPPSGVVDAATDTATDASADAVTDDAAPVDACVPDAAVCGGACVDLASDPNHCGACETACAPGGPHTTGWCLAGECRALCDNQYTDCNADPADGCETHLHTDGACSACGDQCGSGYRCLQGGTAGAWACCVPSVTGCGGCGPLDTCALMPGGGGAAMCCREPAL